MLGCEYTQLDVVLPDTDGMKIRDPLIRWLNDEIASVGSPDVVIAPSFEDGGHEQHNAVAEAATAVFGGNVIHYLTNTRHGGRSTDGTEVELDDPEWISLKLQALACYRSQMRVPNCRPWFYDLLDLREWTC